MSSSRTRRQALALLGLAPLSLPLAADGPGLLVRHMLVDLPPNAPNYELAVLRLLLNKTLPSHGPYRLQAVPFMTQGRAFLQLAAGELDLATSISTVQREAQAEALRVCLYRGLLGLRLPIALASRRAELEGVRTLEQARRLSIAQVESWPDRHVLLANDWPVQTITRRDLYADLLRRGRIDLFALGAIEVYPIVDAQIGLTVLEQWLIAYPAASYFFVSRRRPELAERLRQAWELVLTDGSFVALAEQWLGPQLRRARLAERHWLLLRNPELPAATPLRDARLWHPLVRERLLGVA
ncbi:MAG: hypothetical protein IV092_17220 [Burkholderiaceae bacterium]|nr:hypothetical protein [Burkholderiaceae bacterium]